MPTQEQIDTIHRLHWAEKWPVRKIARHLQIGRATVAKYLANPVAPAVRRPRASKLDPFKPAISAWLQQGPDVTAAVILQRLREQGFDGGHTIVQDYVLALRRETKVRRAYVRMGPAARGRFQIYSGHLRAPR